MKLFKKIFATRYKLMEEIETLESEVLRLKTALDHIIIAPSLFKANNPHKKESTGIMIGLRASSNAALKALQGDEHGQT